MSSPIKMPPPSKPPRLSKSLSGTYESPSSSIPKPPPPGSPTPPHSSHNSPALLPKQSPQNSPTPLPRQSPQNSPTSLSKQLSPQNSPASLSKQHSPQNSPAPLPRQSPQNSPASIRKQSSPQETKQETKMAKMNIISTLAMAQAKERTQSNITEYRTHQQQPPINGTNIPTANGDGTTGSSSVVSTHHQQNGCVQTSTDISPPAQTKRSNGPLIPKPSPPPNLKKKEAESNGTPNKESSNSSPTKKHPLLPPAKARPVSQSVSSSNHQLSPNTRRVNRSVSSEKSSPQTKPLSIPRTKSHDERVIAPEDVSKLPVVDIESNTSDPFDEDCGINGLIHGNVLPISPTSTTSGNPDDTIPEDPLDNDSHTPMITTINVPSSAVTSGGDDEISNPSSNEETDGIKKSVKPQKPIIKPSGKTTRSRGALKDDTSWIKKSSNKKTTPPTSPTTTTQATPTPPQATPTPPASSLSSSSSTSSTKKVTPYRSIAILPDKPTSLSGSALLQDTSKPVIGPSGQYYPPAINRTKTPEAGKQNPNTESHTQTNLSSNELGLRKVKSNDRVQHTVQQQKQQQEEDDKAFQQKNDIPKRFKKTRRSSSFTGTQKVRPVSMMDDVISSKGKKDFTVSTTMTRSMGEAAKKELEEKEKKPKTNRLRGLFSRNRGKSTMVQEEESSSSDDDVGGTITRMPRKSFGRKPWEPQVSDPADDELPEYDQLFEYVFVLGLKEDRVSKKLQTETLYKYPPASKEFAKDDALRSIDQFCFPDIEQWKPVLSYQSENYSFVLTSLTGSRRFGYCRRLLPSGTEARLPEVYCIISPLGCFDLYSNLLDHIEERRAISKAAVYSFLSSVVANRFPAPGRSVSIRVLPYRDRAMETIELRRSHDSRLEHVDFAELYNTLGPKMLIQVFSSFLMERRIILAAQRLSKLSSCCHAFLALLYPFEWQHTFIPVLPNSLIDFCGSPLPFVIGISPTMAKNLNKLDIEMEEALVVDLDKKKFIKEFGDESSILPNKLFQYLKSRLEAAVITNEYGKPPTQRSGQGKADQMIVTAFMTVFAYFFGGLKSFLEIYDTTTGEMRLQKSDFVKSFQSKSTRRFLEAFLMTQMFDKFIEERENPVKSATISQGLFEKELPNLMEKMPEIELFSRKKFWQKRKHPINR